MCLYLKNSSLKIKSILFQYYCSTINYEVIVVLQSNKSQLTLANHHRVDPTVSAAHPMATPFVVASQATPVPHPHVALSVLSVQSVLRLEHVSTRSAPIPASDPAASTPGVRSSTTLRSAVVVKARLVIHSGAVMICLVSGYLGFIESILKMGLQL